MTRIPLEKDRRTRGRRALQPDNSPGDVIFSFFDTRIAALGIARSYCYESAKPAELGSAGAYWEAIGWKIDNPVLPASTER